MSKIVPWFKRRFKAFTESFDLIVKGLFLCVLASSGLSFAVILRILEYRGVIITVFGILIQFVSMIICYVIFKKYLKYKPSEQVETYK